MHKTIFLMSVLTLLCVWMGDLIDGTQGMINALWISCGINLFSYFFSDKLVLKQYKAKEVNAQNAPELYAIIQRLAAQANLPMPKIYTIPEQAPNAFATGRNPKHAAVAATEGLLRLMNSEEIEGVLAHEMSHVRHYDILIGSVASVLAGIIAMISNMARGTMSGRNNDRHNGLFLLIGTILMPLAASVIQMSISRTREYKADEGAAYLTKHPEWLISALSKLENYTQNYRMENVSAQTAHMFIVNPFSGTKQNFSSLFSTHPSTPDRIARLQEIKKSL